MGSSSTESGQAVDRDATEALRAAAAGRPGGGRAGAAFAPGNPPASG